MCARECVRLSSVIKILNREADEVECRRRLLATGARLSLTEKSSFSSLLFYSSAFFSFPPDQQKLMRQSDLEVPHISRRGELISGVAAVVFFFFNLFFRLCVCVSGCHLWDDCRCDSSPEWRMKRMKRCSCSQPALEKQERKRSECDG